MSSSSSAAPAVDAPDADVSRCVRCCCTFPRPHTLCDDNDDVNARRRSCDARRARSLWRALSDRATKSATERHARAAVGACARSGFFAHNVGAGERCGQAVALRSCRRCRRWHRCVVCGCVGLFDVQSFAQSLFGRRVCRPSRSLKSWPRTPAPRRKCPKSCCACSTRFKRRPKTPMHRTRTPSRLPSTWRCVRRVPRRAAATRKRKRKKKKIAMLTRDNVHLCVCADGSQRLAQTPERFCWRRSDAHCHSGIFQRTNVVPAPHGRGVRVLHFRRSS